MYNLNYIDWGPQGWRCPGCGRYYSPTTPMCFYCGNKEVTYHSGTSIDDSEWWKEYLKQSQTVTPVKDNPSMWKGPVPEIHYPSTVQEWFEVFNNGE